MFITCVQRSFLSFYITYSFLVWRRPYAKVRELLNNSQMEQVAGSHFLLSLYL